MEPPSNPDIFPIPTLMEEKKYTEPTEKEKIDAIRRRNKPCRVAKHSPIHSPAPPLIREQPSSLPFTHPYVRKRNKDMENHMVQNVNNLNELRKLRELHKFPEKVTVPDPNQLSIAELRRIRLEERLKKRDATQQETPSAIQVILENNKMSPLHKQIAIRNMSIRKQYNPSQSKENI